MRAAAKHVSNVRARRSNRATGRVTGSPSILEHPFNPVPLELIRFRKRLFMSQATFAARLEVPLQFVKGLEAGALNLSSESLLLKIRQLGAFFDADMEQLERAIKMHGLPMFMLELLWSIFSLGHPACSFQELVGSMRRLGCVASTDDIASALETIENLGYATSQKQRSPWTGKPSSSEIQITPSGYQLILAWTGECEAVGKAAA